MEQGASAHQNPALLSTCANAIAIPCTPAKKLKHLAIRFARSTRSADRFISPFSATEVESLNYAYNNTFLQSERVGAPWL